MLSIKTFTQILLNLLGLLLDLFFISIPFNLFIFVIDKSIFWFLISIITVILNDSGAYFFGKLFGRHSLIDLSPSKTVEGFIGGLFTSVLVSVAFTSLFKNWGFLISPNSTNFDIFGEYSTPEEFVIRDFAILGFNFTTYPAIVLVVILSTFASLIAPLGGFIASGFKRDIKIKDFSNLIPGHGGIIDRIDCQVVNAVFSYLLLSAFLQRE